MAVFFLFLLATAAGSLSTLYWIPEDDMGRGYFQMNALVVLCLQALALALLVLHSFTPFGTAGGFGSGALWAGFAGGFLYWAAVWRERWGLARWAATLALAGTGAALLLAAWQAEGAGAVIPYRDLLLAAGVVGSALLIGWALITMLLGHWYLIAPRLAFRHLIIFCWVLLALAVVRVLLVGAGIAAAAAVDPALEPHPWRVLTSFAGEGAFFWFRLLWGLAIPLVLATMSLHCARQRSNQSATGILYVLVVGVFIGEITALYLTLATGVPV